MREISHPFDAIDIASRGEAVRLPVGDHAVLIMPEPEPGHAVVTLDPEALAFLDHLRHAREASRKGPEPGSPVSAMGAVLDQIPACLTCMDTGEHAVDQDRGWCKCPAGSAARAKFLRIETEAKAAAATLRDVQPLLREED